MASKIIIYGGGGHARVVLDAMQSSGLQVEAVIDSKYDGDLYGIRRLKDIPTDLLDCHLVIAIGDNAVRKDLSIKLSNMYVNAIHPSALISTHASIGTGCMILHRSVIQAGTKVEDHVIINTAAQVDHDCRIGSFSHVAPGSVLCGSVTVGEGTLIGAGAVIKPGVRIGAWATIGAGSVVLKDVPDFAVVVGNPGRILKFGKE